VSPITGLDIFGEEKIALLYLDSKPEGSSP